MSAQIIPFLGPHVARTAPTAPHIEFFAKRRDMNAALLRWLATHPDPQAVNDEIRATINVLAELVKLYG